MTTAPRGDAPGDGRYGEAVFRPEQEGEGERIDFGALAYDDITVARLRALGAGPGWRCLDVGSRHGHGLPTAAGGGRGHRGARRGP